MEDEGEEGAFAVEQCKTIVEKVRAEKPPLQASVSIPSQHAYF
jgi:hypothetical protein